MKPTRTIYHNYQSIITYLDLAIYLKPHIAVRIIIVKIDDLFEEKKLS